MNNQAQAQAQRVYKTTLAQRQANKRYQARQKWNDIQAFEERQARYKATARQDKAEWKAYRYQLQEEEAYFASGALQQQQDDLKREFDDLVSEGKIIINNQQTMSQQVEEYYIQNPISYILN